MVKNGKTKERKTYLLLHNIRSAENAGSIFRTADAVGITKIFLTGYTPTPLDRFGRKRKDIAKTSLGAEEFVSWEYEKSPLKIIRILKKEGIEIIGIEQNKRAMDYRKFKIKSSACFILGNETEGISQKLLSECDAIVEIPQYGKKESLNVSVATGVALFRVLHP
ncbi:MAG: RNA methyltransferase [Patescibacteria group bacterium]